MGTFFDALDLGPWDERLFAWIVYVVVWIGLYVVITRILEKYRGYRRSQKDREGGAGAVQGAQGSPGGAKSGTCPTCSHPVADHFRASTGALWCRCMGCSCGMTGYSLGGTFSLATTAAPRTGDGVKIESQDTEIIAWRAWFLVEHEGDWYLRSFFYPMDDPMRWEGPAVRADKTPELESKHGIYALTEKRFGSVCDENVYSMRAIGGDGHYKAEGFVYGEIALSGTVIEGTNGYRAEQAVVRSITLKLDKAWALTSKQVPLEIQASLEQRYQCPVTLDVGEVAA